MGRVLNFLRCLAPVRLVIMIALQFGALIGSAIVHNLISGRRVPGAQDAAVSLVLCAAMIGVYVLLVRLFERRWPAELTPRPSWALLGLALGCGLFCIVYGLLSVVGAAAWIGFQGFAGVGPALLLAALAAVGEELLFRGVLFRVLEASLGTSLAIAASAIVFGLLHAVNPGATIISTVAIALEAGVMLAAAYAWSRTLWLPIALHLAWNFTEGGVFGAAVSGGHGHGSLFAIKLSASRSVLVTGGAFGPEASLIAVAVCMALGAIFILAAVRAGRWRPAAFRMILD
ncbi:MAG TPA: CPBP family intramembrane glutamic endopeptidase [Caulobacteraceae bacterium]|jgi:hypothetical protein